MHINDVYVLRDVLSAIKAGKHVDRYLINVLLEAATEEVDAFEKHIHELALAEEAAQQ